ncbi:MAG: hypothetical protein AAF903_04155 [Pseudomonadota bacterium]
MKKMITGIALAAMTAAFLNTTTPAPVEASEGNCGFYAFAGAYQSRRNADRQARRVGGQVYDLDQSDSPNAGKGFWVVGIGPGPRGWANQRRREFRSRGARGAYVAARCIWG